MIIRQSSVSKNSSNSQVSGVRKIRRFKFSQLSLSYQVRKKLYEMLISFDDNVNYQFEKQQIKKALIQILDETQQQVAYVTNNVFRYDLNHDGLVTYEQFSNFCLQQHFGQMAIQRLHKNGTYARGKERVMSRKQFIKTLDYCLSFIAIKPQESIVNLIFNQIDLDCDDYITYSDYFTFLKQYFGSQSQSASYVTVSTVEQSMKKLYGNKDRKAIKQQIFKQKIQKKQQTKKVHNPVEVVIKTPLPTVTPVVMPTVLARPTQQMLNIGQRISRLIYHQLKITSMQYDHQMNLCSDQNHANQFLTTIIKISYNRAKGIINQAFQNQSTTSYENLIKYAVQKFMCQDVVQNARSPINKQRFVSQIFSNLHFVKAKPFSFLLEQLYDKYANGKQEISKQQLKMLINIIFASYKWPRVTGQQRIKAPLAQNNYNNNQRVYRF